MTKRNAFKLPFIGVDKSPDYELLYGLNGEFSVVIAITNPVVQYSASPAAYDEFHSLFIGLVKILGDGYLLQKQDIFSRSQYVYRPSPEYLQDKYNAHFAGRDFLKITTYLTITRQVKKGRFYVYDARALRDFRTAVSKVMDVLIASKSNPKLLAEKDINLLIKRILSMDFSGDKLSLNNISPTETELKMGGLEVRSISLVNIDNIDLPGEVGTHIEMNDKDSMRGFPIDMLSFLLKVPAYETILFNQVIEIPNQQVTLNKLEVKRKRHSGIPDPANALCVEDINQLLVDVARDNQLLVNAHFNIIIAAEPGNMQKASNFIESSLFALGIIPNKNAYNQLELFRAALPGNAVELQKYDWFLTTCDAALCFFFKESLMQDEDSEFLIRLTDRQGVPVAMDPADLPMQSGRINNRNRFILGASGTGKSFAVNAIVEQYMLFNMDMVIVDTGHSYSGLCSYYQGKYITYTDKKPITMNPFQITEAEYNIEKKDFLATLICLLWKGADGTVNPVERDVISGTISAYYSNFFMGMQSGELSFNSFYDFALLKIQEIRTEEKVPFDLDEFRYVLKKFYRGGEFASILNENTDQSLFTERFIVFEIDSIKGAHVMAA